MKKQVITLVILMTSTIILGQVGVNTTSPQSSLDVVGKPDDATSMDGITAPRITGEKLRAKTYTASQIGTLLYVTAADVAPAGQTEDVISTGYYYFNGIKWISVRGYGGVNIYNANGTLASDRVVSTGNSTLTFSGNGNSTFIRNTGTEAHVEATGTGRGSLTVTGGNSTVDFYADNNNLSQISSRGTGNTGLSIKTEGANPVILSTSNSERLRLTSAGDVGINTSIPTERLHNNGNVRLQGLPLNGATNAIFTTSSGTASSSQNQTFTGTRTVITDENGVVGYVTGMPVSGPGSSKLILSTSVTGAQNIGSAPASGVTSTVVNYPNENSDTENAWNNGTFTTPFTGIYVISTQLSNSHTTTGSNSGWFSVTRLQKSSNGGTNWSDLSRDTRSNLSQFDVDNGSILYWTGTLSAGELVRVFSQCNSTTSNLVQLGTLTVTRLIQ